MSDQGKSTMYFMGYMSWLFFGWLIPLGIVEATGNKWIGAFALIGWVVIFVVLAAKNDDYRSA